MAKITVRTNGQTLLVNASVSHWTTAALAVVASGDDDIPSTTTTTITSDYDMHFANTATTATITVTQLDGTQLLAQTFDVNPGVGPRVLNPVPDPFQLASDDGGKVGFAGYLASGQYYLTGWPHSNSTSSTLGNGTLRLYPFFVPNACSISKIGAEVTSAGEASSVVRLGMYADNGGGYPGSLLVDAGTIAGDGATGMKEITLSTAQAVTRGLYWIGGAVQAAASTQPTMRTMSNGNTFLYRLGTSAPGTNVTVCGYSETGVSGALPPTFSTSIAVITSAARVHVKVA